MAQHRGGGPGARFTAEKKRAKDTRGTTLRIWNYLKRRKAGLALALVFIVINTGLSLLGPYLTGKVIDEAIIPGDLGKLERLIAVLIGVYLATSALTWAQAWVMAGVAQSALRDIRTDLFGKLQVLELRFFDERPHGETMSRLTNDVDNINQVLTESVTQIVSPRLAQRSCSRLASTGSWAAGRGRGSVPNRRSLVPSTASSKRRSPASVW